MFLGQNPFESSYGGYGEFWGSFFPTAWLSFHGRAQGLLIKRENSQWNWSRDTNLLVLQLGNIGNLPFRFVIGRGQLPLGISEPILKGWFQSQFKTIFYKTPKNSAYITWDNKVNFLLDFGVAYEHHELGEDRNDLSPKKDLAKALSLRFIYDFPILKSTRSVFSIYAENDGKRRWSLGLVSIGERLEETHIDVIREISTPDGKNEDFKQNIRFGFKGSIQNSSRWSFELDDEKDFITVAAIYYEINIFQYLWYTQGVGYREVKDQSQPSGWVFLMGLGTQI